MYRYAKFKGCDVSVGENTNILSTATLGCERVGHGWYAVGLRRV